MKIKHSSFAGFKTGYCLGRISFEMSNTLLEDDNALMQGKR